MFSVFSSGVAGVSGADGLIAAAGLGVGFGFAGDDVGASGLAVAKRAGRSFTFTDGVAGDVVAGVGSGIGVVSRGLSAFAGLRGCVDDAANSCR